MDRRAASRSFNLSSVPANVIMKGLLSLLFLIAFCASASSQNAYRNQSGGLASADSVRVRVTFLKQSGVGSGNYFIRSVAGVNAGNVDFRNSSTVVKEWVYTFGGFSDLTKGFVLGGSIYSASSGGTQVGMQRVADLTVTWTVIDGNYGPSNPVPPTGQILREYTVKVWPPGTDLDEVDPVGPIGGQETADFEYSVENDDVNPYTMRLLVDGQEVDRVVVGAKSSAQGSFSKSGLNAGSVGSYEWQVEKPDGTWQSLGGEGEYSIGVDGSPSSFNGIDFSFRGNDPQALPDIENPTGEFGEGREGDGTPENTDDGGNTKNPTNKGVNSSKSGAIIADVYDDVRAALNQSGNGDTAIPDSPANFEIGEQAEPVQDGTALAKVGDIGDMVDSSLGDIEGGKGSFFARFSDKPIPLPSVPASGPLIYNVSLPVLGAFTINLTPFAGVISKVRGLMLLVLYISFWIFTVKAIRVSIA